MNQSWNRFAVANALADENFCVGKNYLEVCETARGDCAEEAEAAAGIRAVLAGSLAGSRWSTRAILRIRSAGSA